MPNEIFSRNQAGLIEGLEYKFNSDNTINWRGMIPSEFIKINKGAFRDGEEIPESAEGLPDSKLLILLGGIKWAAAARGLKRRDTKIDYISDTRAVCTVSVEFIKNSENPDGLVYSDCAAASKETTNSFGQIFLETIAANRAFVRAVRNALGINIVGNDEIAPKAGGENCLPSETSEEIVGVKPQDSLKRKVIPYLKKKGVIITKFEDFKEYVSKKNMDGIDPTTWRDWYDIPVPVCFTLMGKLQS